MGVQTRTAKEIAKEIVVELGVFGYHGGGKDLKEGVRIALHQLDRADIWHQVVAECRRLGETTGTR